MVRALNWSQKHPVETFPAVFAAESFTVPQATLKKESWQLETQANRLLLEQIIGTGIPLRKYVGTRVYRGITTGFNDAFVIDGATRSKLIGECQSSDEIIKPYMRGQDVARWSGVSPDKWIIFTRKGINICDYPAVLKYLEGRFQVPSANNAA